MATILHIETSTNVCSVAVSYNDKLVFYREETQGPSHASLLGVFVQEAVKALKGIADKPDAIAVSAGPGSYTGLRIGVSEAKGLCYGWGIPLIAIETLELLTSQVLDQKEWGNQNLFCPMIDARRMEVYTCLYGNNLEKVQQTTAEIIDNHSFSDQLKDHQLIFFGNGAAKCKQWILSENAVFLDDIYPRARDMIQLAQRAYLNERFVDIAYYEPFYLKEFVGTIPKNKVLG